MVWVGLAGGTLASESVASLPVLAVVKLQFAGRVVLSNWTPGEGRRFENRSTAVGVGG